jgi:hypothetical protein
MSNPSISRPEIVGSAVSTARNNKGARNNLLLKISRNPLISLDSYERIQGNPRKSNPQKLEFRGQTATFQETPNRVENGVAPAVDTEPNRLLPNAQAA